MNTELVDNSADVQCAETPKDELIRAYRDEIARLHRCITMAMGCLDPESKSRDERLAWYRLFDAEAGIREPRDDLSDDPPPNYREMRGILKT